MDLAHPRREQVDAPERVAQLVAREEPRLAAGLPGRGRAGQPGQPVEAGLVPRRVAAVHPGDDDVDGERALVHGRRGHQWQRGDVEAVDRGGHLGRASGEPLRVPVAGRRHQLPVDALLPELHLDGAALAEDRTFAGLGAGRLWPRLDRHHRRPPAEQVRGQHRDGRPALVPAVRGRVAQREVRRCRGRRELLEEPVPGGHRQHEDRRPRLVRRHHEPVVGRGPGGRDCQRERCVPGRCGRHAGRVVRRRRGWLRRGRRRQGGVPEASGPARDGGLEDLHPPGGEHVGVPLGRRLQGPGPQPVPQVVVGAEPEQRRGHAGDGLGRDEQAVHLVPDDLPRTGGTVEGHAGDAGRHRLLQPEREPLGP